MRCTTATIAATSCWVIFQSFHSPTLAGFAVISHWVPYLIFSVYAGALADRFDCRRLIQVAQGLLMLASLAWGVLFLTGALRAWHAAALLTLHGMAGVIASPPIQLIVHDIVGPEHLASAIRLNAISRYFSMLVGPAVGGGLMLVLGPGVVLLVNVLLYLPLTLFLFRMPYTGHRREGDHPRPAPRFSLAEARRVLAEVRSEPRIVRMIVLAGATSFFVRSRRRCRSTRTITAPRRPTSGTACCSAPTPPAPSSARSCWRASPSSRGACARRSGAP